MPNNPYQAPGKFPTIPVLHYWLLLNGVLNNKKSWSLGISPSVSQKQLATFYLQNLMILQLWANKDNKSDISATNHFFVIWLQIVAQLAEIHWKTCLPHFSTSCLEWPYLQPINTVPIQGPGQPNLPQSGSWWSWIAENDLCSSSSALDYP